VPFLACLIALAVALSVSGCRLGTDESPDPLKPCPPGYARSFVPGSYPIYEYACFQTGSGQ
jgi:hypothetical protein